MAKAFKKVSYRELTRQYQLLKELMDSIPDVIYFKDKQGRLILVNQAHARGLGLRPEQVIGRSDFDIFSKERAEAMRKDDLRVMSSGKPLIDKIERSTRPDGIDNYVSTTKIPRFDAKGRVTGLIGITRDITRRMQQEYMRQERLRLEKKIESLKELNRLKSEFVSVVSHELRTPLAIIKEAVGLVFDGVTGEVSDKQKKILQRANNNILRLKGLIEELLDISRIESGILKLHYTLVNLKELLEETSEFFKKSAAQKEIILEYELAKENINIFIDADRINQVITNLLSNAIKFSEEGAKVKVQLRVFESKVRVGVIDTGVGIASEDIPRLFNKFVQLLKVPPGGRKGLGLGLSIAKELIEKHGGEIWVESKPGVGSKFYFTLPKFYNLDSLSGENRQQINRLLLKGEEVHFINITIVNYQEFSRRLAVDSLKLLAEFRHWVACATEECWPAESRPLPLISAGELKDLSIIFTGVKEKEILKFCQLLKGKISGYFLRSRIKDVFVTVGLSLYPQRISPPVVKEFPANLVIKEIFIGSELRRFPRLSYLAEVDILNGDRSGSSPTVDITEAGICFRYHRPLQTDAKVLLRLRLPGRKLPLRLNGRVAWISEGSSDLGKNRYKVGLEFEGLREKNRKLLAKNIKKAFSFKMPS